MFTVHRYVLKYKQTTHFTVVLIDVLFLNFCRDNVVVSGFCDSKSQNKIVVKIFC